MHRTENIDTTAVSVRDIDHYEPLPDAHITITFDDDTRLTLNQRSTQTDIQARHETDEMLYQTITDNRTEIRELINDISGDIPDDVERTARRLLQLDAWLVDNNPTRARDSFLDVHGTYRPMRTGQNQLFLVEEANQVMCDRVLPFVVSLHKPAWSHRNQAIKPRLSKTLEKRTLRAVDAFTETKFKEDPVKQITVTKFQTVESLAEAERIVKGEPRVPTNDSPNTSETTDQASLNSF
jgi:hypothetical protein